MDEAQNTTPGPPPVPAPPLTDPNQPASPNEPGAPVPPQTDDNDPSDPPLTVDGEERRGEGGEEGAPLYDGGEVPGSGDETLRTEDQDVLDETHDLDQ